MSLKYRTIVSRGLGEPTTVAQLMEVLRRASVHGAMPIVIDGLGQDAYIAELGVTTDSETLTSTFVVEVRYE